MGHTSRKRWDDDRAVTKVSVGLFRQDTLQAQALNKWRKESRLIQAHLERAVEPASVTVCVCVSKESYRPSRAHTCGNRINV